MGSLKEAGTPADLRGVGDTLLSIAVPVVPSPLEPTLPVQDELQQRLKHWTMWPLGVGASVWAFAPFLMTWLRAVREHQVFTGAFGPFPWDDLQYLSFVRAGHSGLIANLFGGFGAHVYADPLWSLSGIVQGLTGAGPALLMASWIAMAVVVLLWGTRYLVAHHLSDVSVLGRWAAAALALFGGFTPIFLFAAASSGNAGMLAIDVMPAGTLWGYAPIAIAIGLMPAVIVGLERIATGHPQPRTSGLTAGGCLLVGWLHPWQAATLMGVWVGLLALALWRGELARPSVPAAAVTGALLAAPAYYAVLSHVDQSWAHFSRIDAGGLVFTPWLFEPGVLPLLVIALAAAWANRRDRSTHTLILWVAATCVLVAARPPEQYHALDGLMLPVSVLCVRALCRQPRRSLRWVPLFVTLISLPVTGIVVGVRLIAATQSEATTAYTSFPPNDVSAARRAAVRDGGRPILTTVQLGTALPSLTGASSWDGDLFWTPNGVARAAEAANLFQAGDMGNADERAFVRQSAARAVVEPCGATSNLGPALAPLGFHAERVGCATLYLRS